MIRGPTAKQKIALIAAAEKRSNAPSFASSACGDWVTPADVLERVYRVAWVALDPCSGPGSLVKAVVSWRPPDDDGLCADWRAPLLRSTASWEPSSGLGLAYVNPPYGRSIKAWAAKIVAEANRGCEILALLPSRTDAGWWHLVVEQASAVALTRGRIQFVAPPGVKTSQNTVGSTFIYYGPRVGRFVSAFCEDGFARRIG